MFIPKSHGIGYTLATNIWREYYWNPKNSLGYRDNEIEYSKVKKKKKIFILGDSITAGHGIRNVHNRFSNILGKKLTENYKVFNLGKNGSDTKDEFKRLLAYPFKPDFLVLQYYCNDIDQIAISKGKRFNGFTPYKDSNRFSQILIRNSYLINYIYWIFPHLDTKSYADFLLSSYQDRTILQEHLSDLNNFIEFSEEESIDLIVLLFPYLQDLEFCSTLLILVENFFIEKGIKVINVSGLVEDIPSKKRIVNLNDAHPSVLINKLVADEVFEALQNNILDQTID